MPHEPGHPDVDALADLTAPNLDAMENFQGLDEDQQQQIKNIQAGQKTDWGAGSISASDFINEDGSPKTVKEIYDTLDKKLPGVTGEKLMKAINNLMPKYQGIDKKEAGFLAEERAFTEEGAKTKMAQDVYGLQQQAGQVGGAMRNVYGGMGGGMRGSMAGQGAMQKGFGTAEDAYDLSKRKAEFAERKGMYGLEKTAYSDFESDIEGLITESGWMKHDPNYMRGLYGQQSEWGSWMKNDETPKAPTFGENQVTPNLEENIYAKGGKVPTKDESFLKFLTELPDAGGN